MSIRNPDTSMEPNLCAHSISRRERLHSLKSRTARACGRKRHICRTNSDPMDPPAPVTRIRLLFRYRLISSSSSRTSSLPNRSSRVTSRIAFTETFPSIISIIPGTVRNLFPVFSHRSTIRLICSPRAEGTAISISSNFA